MRGKRHKIEEKFVKMMENKEKLRKMLLSCPPESKTLAMALGINDSHILWGSCNGKKGQLNSLCMSISSYVI